MSRTLKQWIEFVEEERSKRSTQLLEDRKKAKMEQFLQSLTAKQSAMRMFNCNIRVHVICTLLNKFMRFASSHVLYCMYKQ